MIALMMLGVLAVATAEEPAEETAEEPAEETAEEAAEEAEVSLERQIAESAGILGSLGECQGDDDCAAQQGLGGSGLNPAIVGGIGGLIGAKPGPEGEPDGAFGAQPPASGGSFGARGESAQGRLVGEPVVLGQLDPALVQEVVIRHLNQVRYCYQRELAKGSPIGGDLVITFTVAADGSVDAAKVKSSTLGSPPVESCVVNRFVRMRFPAPRDKTAARVSVAFAFQPADAPPAPAGD